MLSVFAKQVAVIVAMALSFVAPVAWAALPPDTLRVHYHREGGDYDGWGLHVWGDVSVSRAVTWAHPLPVTGQDSFGVYFDVPLAGGAQHIGFILHQGSEKNVKRDMVINPQTQGYEVWQLENDGNLYGSRAAAAAALPSLASDTVAAKPDPRLEKQEAARDARAKADMLALAREAEKAQKNQPAQPDAAALKEKEKQDQEKAKAEQDRLQQERDKLVQQLIAQRDAAGQQQQRQLYLQRQAAMKEDMRRRAEALEQQQPHHQRIRHLDPLTQFMLWIGGGVVVTVVGVMLLIWRNRRVPASTPLLETTKMSKHG